jgi:CBS domain-containing protein
MSWTVADVMTKDPVTVRSATSFKACVNLMRIHEMSAIPVVDHDCRIVGIVSESDLLAKEARPQRGKARAMRAAELMTTDLVTTTAGATLATAASLMFQHHVKVLPVVDPRQRLVGMVTRAQVLKVFLRSDESIRKEVVRSMADAPGLELGGSEIEVKDGVVNVYGMTETDRPAELIVLRAMAVPGVVGIRYHPTLPTERAVAEISHGGGRHG